MRQVRLEEMEWLAQGDRDCSQWQLRYRKSGSRAHSLTHFITSFPNGLVPSRVWLFYKTPPVLICILAFPSISSHSRALEFGWGHVTWSGRGLRVGTTTTNEGPRAALWLGCPCRFSLDCGAAKWKQHESWHPLLGKTCHSPICVRDALESVRTLRWIACVLPPAAYPDVTII